MTCRLVVILPVTEALKPRFYHWQSERTSGATVTMSLGFENEAVAMKIGHNLPYVWAVEATEARS